jgi:hypothetical protein
MQTMGRGRLAGERGRPGPRRREELNVRRPGAAVLVETWRRNSVPSSAGDLGVVGGGGGPGGVRW